MKLQISLEFLLVFSFILTVFLVIFAIIAARGAELSNQQVYSQTQLVAQSVAQEINTAYNSGNGYSGNMVLESGYGINPYNITILQNGEVIVTAQEAQQKIQSEAFSQARNLLVGNVVNTGYISVQNFFGAVCVDTACPTPSNYPSVVSLPAQLIHVAQFNGASSYINISSFTGLEPTTATTISAWVYANSGGPNYASVYSLATGAGAGGVNFTGSGFLYYESGSWYGTSGGSFTNKDTWLNVVAVDNGGAITVYSDDVLEALVGGSGQTIGAPASPYVEIGHSAKGSTFFNGLISNVQVYNTSLSATQIAQLYGEGITGAPVLPANIVGWWPLNGNAYDYSGDNNAGIANNVIFPTVSVLQARVSDAYGHPINGILVGLSTTKGVFTQNAFTASYATNGIASAFVTQNFTGGAAIINATVYPGSLGEQENLTAWWPLNQTFST